MHRYSRRLWAALLAEFLGLAIFQVYGGSANDDVAALANGITLAVIGKLIAKESQNVYSFSIWAPLRYSYNNQLLKHRRISIWVPKLDRWPFRSLKHCLTAVYATCNVSGGHLNPAVSFANCLTGHMSWSRGGVYVIAQVLGAIFGALVEVCNFLLMQTFPQTQSIGGMACPCHFDHENIQKDIFIIIPFFHYKRMLKLRFSLP